MRAATSQGPRSPCATAPQSIALFRASDKDGDGKLTLKELTSVLKQFGQMEDEEEMDDEDDDN